MSSTMGLGFKKLLSLGAVALTMTLASQVTAGTIKNSAHDFSVASVTGAPAWTNKQICIACHTPHNADTTTDAPLWNHTTTAATGYKPYTGVTTVTGLNTMDAVVDATPSGTTLLCLSCHDGTVALDSFGGAAGGAVTISASANLGGVASLSNDHPVSFIYDATLVGKDLSLFPTTNPSNMLAKTTNTLAGTGTIASDLLEGGTRMECSSCHDVHNTFTGAVPAAGTKNYLLKVSMDQSLLCLTCHDK